MSIYNYHVLKASGFSESRIVKILNRIEVKAFDADQKIWTKTQSQHPWCHVLDGLVGATIAGRDGEISPVDIFGPGSWFGESTIFKRDSTHLEFVALAETRVLVVPHDEASKAFSEEPDFTRFIARILSWRDRQHTEMLALSRVGNPALRVVLGLAKLAEALVSGSSHAPVIASGDQLEIPLKQSILAGICGVSRGVFSEIIQQLVTGNWLSISYSSITLNNCHAWEKFSSAQCYALLNDPRPSMPDLLNLLEVARSNDVDGGAIHITPIKRRLKA